MLDYQYEARDPKTGEKVSALIQAESEKSAAKLLQQQGLAPLSIKPVTAGGGFGRFGGKIKVKDRILFSRQLSTLINAGLPLLQSLRSVNNQTSNKAFKLVINKVVTSIEAGSSFADALSKHPEVFNQVYISMVAAGEASGTLDKSLERLAIQQEKDADIISKVRGAMVYPVIVVLVMVGVVAFMMIAVLPQVQVLYDGMPNANLPLLTRVLLAVSDFTRSYWWIVVAIIGLISFFTSRWARTLGGKQVIDKAKLKAGPFGSLFMKMYMARFARTGSTLIQSGVPLIQMLEITSRAVSNVHVAKSIDMATDKVRGGKSLADSLQNDPNFLPLVPDMLRIGEQSGSTEDMLAKTADYYEKEVDNEIRTVSTIIEPVMIIVLGTVALVIVAAILLPIYGLVGQNSIV